MSNYKLPKNIEDDRIIVTWKALKYAPYSQACICTIERKDDNYKQYILFSYNTAIISIWSNNVMYVSPDVNVSMTTTRHVNRFCKEMNDLLGTSIDYYSCKYNMNKLINVFTGEVITDYGVRDARNEEDELEDLYWQCRRLNK